ncbi:MAG: molybdenum cofactor biosynthesis protein [Acidilobus sp.]
MRRLRVKLYSLLREEVGASEIELEVPDHVKVSDVLGLLAKKAPRSISVLGPSLRVIADGSPLDIDEEVPPSSAIIHVLPPSSGGEDRVQVRVVRGNQMDLNEVISFLSDDNRVGALALFIGVVREVNKEERVRELRYEHAEGLLEGALKNIGEEAVRNFGLSKVFIAHYVGVRMPGELTMVVGVASASRTEAFPALQWIVDKVKHEAPIWKEEVRDSGRYLIVGNEEIKAQDLASST